jgi:hypothetical protein
LESAVEAATLAICHHVVGNGGSANRCREKYIEMTISHKLLPKILSVFAKLKDLTYFCSEIEKTKMNIIDYQQKFNNDFRELFTTRLKEDEDFGCELWSAIANVHWLHDDDETKTACGRSFRGAGSLIASMLGKGTYTDWYCSGPYCTVSGYIAETMASRGWQYVLLDDENS